MVHFYKKTHTYDETPATPLLAFFLRYPNPFARHVLCVDVLSRTIDPRTGQIRTLRLILKRGLVPSWASKWLPLPSGSGGRGLDAWVLEESVVDPPGWGADGSPAEVAAKRDEARRRRERSKGRMQPHDEDAYLAHPRLKSTQGNLSHKKFMHVVEGAELCSGREGTTLHHTTAEVRSQFGGSWGQLIRDKIESYGANKLPGNTDRAREGMSLIMNLLRRRERGQPAPADTPEPPSV